MRFRIRFKLCNYKVFIYLIKKNYKEKILNLFIELALPNTHPLYLNNLPSYISS